MLLQRIEIDRFLSYGQLVQVNVDPSLTVVTGPNAAGKSNLGRCLALAQAVVASSFGEHEQLGLYDDAGYEGVGEFTVKLNLELDQPWERDLVLNFVRGCFSTWGKQQDADEAVQLDEMIANSLVGGSVAPLWQGSLVIRYRAASSRPWSAAWEFNNAGDTWHVLLVGDHGGAFMRPGTLQHSASGSSPLRFTDWLLTSKPQGSALLDFRTAMQHVDRPVQFNVHAVQNRLGGLPTSLRTLGSSLDLDPTDTMIIFSRVIDLVLRRSLVLTDNRRLPLRRYFSLAELDSALDLRDGAAVGAELYRLKNGYSQDQARFREIQATFRSLTNRDLEIRARPGKDNNNNDAMIIEPVVRGVHGVRLIELSGAGMQEALVLSTILEGRPGQVTVLDEPAVNLEPTVQRRLVSKIRGPGQYLVITHSADLVPFDEPGDLTRIVRVSPGSQGSQIRQPDFSNLTPSGLMRQLHLLAPADVRALLFSAGVVLCEGSTEVAALPRWWGQAGKIGLVDPTAANIDVLSVDGQEGFGAYLRYLDAFDVPWVVVADGPALRSDSKLAADLRSMDRWPSTTPPEDRDDFRGWRNFFEIAGIYTLADQFGDDGSKLGEFEAFLERIDKDLCAKAKAEGGRSKPRRGAYFALHHPDAPSEALDLYTKIASRLGLAE